MDDETFGEEVSRRAGVPPDRARVFIQATLETLAERISGGEAHDLASQLPKQMKEWLKKNGERAEPFGLDEFIRRVSERTGAPPEESRVAVKAVFRTLGQAVTGGEFTDVMSQLPGEFRELTKP
jgi:uncharacterized protein (DUF2267 family)